MSVLKVPIISYDHRAWISENQTRSLIFQGAELRCKLSPQPPGDLYY